MEHLEQQLKDGMEKESEDWHLDKKVPIGIIMALLIQTLAFVYTLTAWKADVDGRLLALERSDSQKVSHETRLAVTEQGVIRIREDLAEIKSLIRGQQKDSGSN